MDITNYILDNETKVVNTIFLNKNIFDHHLDNENTYNLWLCELYKIINISNVDVSFFTYNIIST